MSYINPEMLTWARERVGMSMEDLALKTKRPLAEVKKWETGEVVPAYGRLEEMAYKHYQVPVAIFFFPKPPNIEDPIKKFRRLPDYELEKFSNDTYKKILLAQSYQDSLPDILKGHEPKGSAVKKFIDRTSNSKKLAKEVRKYIGVSFEEQFYFRSSTTALKQWRYALEQVGIFTFKDSFKDNFISGFCLFDEDYPVVMLNNSNSFTRQIFSLIHELGHILLGINGITDVDESYIEYLSGSEKKAEIFCNQFASEFLVPSEEFKEDIKTLQSKGLSYVSEIADQYSVSREVILRKLLDKNVISQSLYLKKSAEWNKDYLRNLKGSPGGNYYLTKISYLGETFTKLAFTQYQKGLFSKGQLANHLNVKAKNLNALESTVRW
jgi:Zn-dependent peptidase ImmA (M78 family)